MGYTSPYFQYDGLEGVKWTFAVENILFAVSGLRGIVFLRGLDNTSPSSAVRWDAEQWSPALLGKIIGERSVCPTWKERTRVEK